jgi:ribonuclease P protein component
MPPLSWPKHKRLVRKSDFALVRESGFVQRGRLLLLGTRCDEATTGFRAGFITSKRLGNAVTRNRVRRRLRDIVRRHQGRLRRGTWLVTIGRPAAGRASHGALEDEWLRLAERASILTP